MFKSKSFVFVGYKTKMCLVKVESWSEDNIQYRARYTLALVYLTEECLKLVVQQ